MRGFAKTKKAAQYAGVSERTMRDWLKQGLKHSRLLTGTILISYDDIDNYIKKYAVSESQVDQIVDSVMKEF